MTTPSWVHKQQADRAEMEARSAIHAQRQAEGRLSDEVNELTNRLNTLEGAVSSILDRLYALETRT